MNSNTAAWTKRQAGSTNYDALARQAHLKRWETRLLREALIRPALLTGCKLLDWNRVIREGKPAGLLARLYALLEERGLGEEIPAPVRPHLIAARVFAESEQRSIRWEVNRIQRALEGVDTSIILLKGAAYLLAELPVARGRICSDVDILVPQEMLGAVEQALLNHGWQHQKLEDYDQFFYRAWSHELPPLQHRQRGTVVDVHHTILPLTGRLHPDPRKLLEAAVAVDGAKLKVLAPADMVLHSAAHAFQDGELRQILRDLVDLDGLLRDFIREPKFWDDLIARAEELDLRRPLYYGLRYTRLYLETPIPDRVLETCRRWQPAWPASVIMDKLVDEAVDAADPTLKGLGINLALWLLYVRSHWLRMPPHLLIPHLARKAFMRRRN